MTATEYRSHFSLWAMMAAPLIAGNDIAHMDDATRAILLNKDVIAVDQDRLGVQGHRVAKEGTSEVWMKPLTGGAVAVLLFNRGEQPAAIRARHEQIGLAANGRVKVRDLWTHQDVRSGGDVLEATVEPHGVAMFKIGG